MYFRRNWTDSNLKRELSRRAHVEAEEGDLLPDPDPLLHHVRDVLLLVQPGNKGLFEQLWS